MVFFRVAEHILTPEGERRLNETTVSGPVFDTLENFLGGTICNLIGQQEAFLRVNGLQSVANLVSLGRRRLNCFPGGAGTEPPHEVGPNQARDAFTGGQCDFSYDIEATTDVISSSGTEFERTRFAVVQGPVVTVEINPASGNPGIWYRQAVDGPLLEAGGLTMSTGERNLNLGRGGFKNVMVVPSDGSPDVCGNSPAFPEQFPPGQDLPPAPNPGDVLIDREIRTFDIDVDGVQVPFSYEVGPVTIDVDANIVIPLFNSLFRISPTLELEVDVNLGPGGGNDIEEDVAAIRALLEQDIAGMVNSGTCSGDPFPVPYAGQGLLGLASAIEAATDAITVASLSSCPVGNSGNLLGPLDLVQSGIFVEGQVEIIAIPDDAVIATLEVTNVPDNLRVFKLAGDETEARFGFWSIQLGSSIGGVSGESVSVFTPTSRLDIPPFQGFQRFVRLSLKREVFYNLYIQRFL